MVCLCWLVCIGLWWSDGLSLCWLVCIGLSGGLFTCLCATQPVGQSICSYMGHSVPMSLSTCGSTCWPGHLPVLLLASFILRWPRAVDGDARSWELTLNALVQANKDGWLKHSIQQNESLVQANKDGRLTHSIQQNKSLIPCGSTSCHLLNEALVPWTALLLPRKTAKMKLNWNKLECSFE